MDRHLAFVSVPGHGHVNPTLPLVAELVRRGWRVSYATHERFSRAVADAGATLVPTQGDMPAPPPFTDFDPDRFADLLLGFVADARVDVPRLEAHFRRDPPQAVCYDSASLTGRVLAGRLGLPDVALVPNLASNERFSPFGGFVSSLSGRTSRRCNGPGRRCRTTPPSRGWSRRRARCGAARVAEHRVRPPRVPARRGHLR